VIEVIEPIDEVLRGVFKFEDDRLVVCLRRRSDGEVPADFNAPAGSHNMLIQLRMVDNSRKPAPSAGVVSPSSVAPIRSASIQTPAVAAPTAAPAASAASDPAIDPIVAARQLKIRTMLVGTWTHQDPQGTVTTALFNDGTFQSTRRWNDAAGQFLNGRTTSSGKWTYNRGYVSCTVDRSTDPEAVGQVIKNRVHSIGDQSVTYIDLVGRIQHGTRIQ
jgi:hypothetical protein